MAEATLIGLAVGQVGLLATMGGGIIWVAKKLMNLQQQNQNQAVENERKLLANIFQDNDRLRGDLIECNDRHQKLRHSHTNLIMENEWLRSRLGMPSRYFGGVPENEQGPNQARIDGPAAPDGLPGGPVHSG